VLCCAVVLVSTLISLLQWPSLRKPCRVATKGISASWSPNTLQSQGATPTNRTVPQAASAGFNLAMTCATHAGSLEEV